MIEKQMTIFDVFQSQREDDFEELIQKLRHYGIDDFYKKRMKGKGFLTTRISSELENIPTYVDYKRKMLELLIEYYKNDDDITIIYHGDLDYIRINSDRSRSSYPVFCLEMVNKKDR